MTCNNLVRKLLLLIANLKLLKITGQEHLNVLSNSSQRLCVRACVCLGEGGIVK